MVCPGVKIFCPWVSITLEQRLKCHLCRGYSIQSPGRPEKKKQKKNRREYGSIELKNWLPDVNYLVSKKIIVFWEYYTIMSRGFIIEFRVPCLHPGGCVTNFTAMY